MPCIKWGHPRLILESYLNGLTTAPEEKQLPKRLAEFKEQYARACEANWDVFKDEFVPKWNHVQKSTGADVLRFETITPLVAQLSRPSIFENAGLPLEHTYGFIQLPTSQIKGCARAYAETVWFAEQFESKPDSVEPLDDEQRAKALAAWFKIEKVFGWSENPLHEKSDWLSPCIASLVKKSRKGFSSIGAIVFGDGIPDPEVNAFPKLQAEVLNNHHQAYYNGRDAKHECPPGDWEDPLLINFLAISGGSRFLIPIRSRDASRISTETQEDVRTLLNLANAWLEGGLYVLGFGARTGVDYGQMKLVERSGTQSSKEQLPTRTVSTVEQLTEAHPAEPSTATNETRTSFDAIQSKKVGRRIQLSFQIELTTPAFLAGVDQKAGDCDLVAKSFKHGVRWWWRTMHSGFLTPRELLEEEGKIFGSTVDGNRMSVRVRRMSGEQLSKPIRFNFRNQTEEWKKDRSGRDVLRKPYWNQIAANQIPVIGIPVEQKPKTVQGLFYQAYGMDQTPFELDQNKKPVEGGLAYKDDQRYYLDTGNRWQVLIDVQPRSQAQVLMALKLFSAFGGVGSRSRKGFGSFKISECERSSGHVITSLVREAIDAGQEYRKSGDIPDCDFAAEKQITPSLANLVDPPAYFTVELPAPTQVGFHAPFFAIDRLGQIMQSFAKTHKKDPRKSELGLPRENIHPKPEQERCLGQYFRIYEGRPRHRDHLENPQNAEKLQRFSAPLFFRGELHDENTFGFSVILMHDQNIKFIGETSIVSELAVHLRKVPSWKIDSSDK